MRSARASRRPSRWSPSRVGTFPEPSCRRAVASRGSVAGGGAELRRGRRAGRCVREHGAGAAGRALRGWPLLDCLTCPGGRVADVSSARPDRWSTVAIAGRCSALEEKEEERGERRQGGTASRRRSWLLRPATTRHRIRRRHRKVDSAGEVEISARSRLLLGGNRCRESTRRAGACAAGAAGRCASPSTRQPASGR